MTHSDLSERPQFEPDEPRVWPLGGEDRGKLLTGFSSANLLAKRAYVEQHNIGGDLDWLVAQIDEVLNERGGE